MRSSIFVATLLTTGISSGLWLSINPVEAMEFSFAHPGVAERTNDFGQRTEPYVAASSDITLDRTFFDRVFVDETLNANSTNSLSIGSTETLSIDEILNDGLVPQPEPSVAASSEVSPINESLNPISRDVLSIDDILSADGSLSPSLTISEPGAAIIQPQFSPLVANAQNINAVASITANTTANAPPTANATANASATNSRLTLADARWDEFINAHTPDLNLRIQPRFSAGHTSSGAYTNGVTRLEGWIPLRQRAGENITFAEPRFNVDNKGNLGGTVLIGHRDYDNDTDRLWAGYVAWDIRETENRTFNQLGLGMETLGDIWDVHLNGYIPLGDRNATLEETVFSSGGLTSSTTFEENLLVLSERQSETRIFRENVSLGGFDIGTTVELADWNDEHGDLRALASLYYLGGPGIEDDLGWRLGLELRPIEQVVMGIAVQDDQIFGTNVLASITVNFIRVRPKDDVLDDFEEEFEVVERLGEPIRRNSTIAVATNTDVDTTITEVREPLYNPQNGRDDNPGAYRFIHVSLGANTNGDGTFENPYNNIDDAIANAEANSGVQNSELAENQIIYVDASTSVDINAFEIPAGVRVLSQGPIQLLNGSNDSFSTFPVVAGRLPFSPENNFNIIAGEESGIVVTLPGSGDGDFPLVDSGANNLIVMNSNTVLSGFRIEDAARNAILARGATNVEIRDSFIVNAGERGIFLDEVEGQVFLFDNDIANINGGAGSGQGIFINNASTTVEVVAREQTIRNARVGFEVNAADVETGTASQFVEIEAATISTSSEQGLLLTASGRGNSQNILITDNTSIDNSGAEGLWIEAQDGALQEVTFQDGRVTDSGNAGIRIIGGTEDEQLAIAQEIFIFDSRIARNNGAGIDIVVNEQSTQELGIRGNNIVGNAGDGIQAVANNLAFLEFVTDSDNDSEGISENTITGNNGQGIDINANDFSTMLADIQDNDLENTATANGLAELEVTSSTNSVAICAYVFNNNATTLGSIILDNNSTGLSQGLFQVAGLTDTAILTSNTTSTGTLTFLPDLSFFSEPENPSSCFTEAE
ncbi:MAG: right-handed parallel beta-helix repeat-containing protein [Leptolyngbyaceae cyanobacterium]